MDLLHSRPNIGTRDGSDIMKKHLAPSFELRIPAETICINVLESKVQLFRSFFFQNLQFNQKSERNHDF